jgi:preprotein translocase subunit SecG
MIYYALVSLYVLVCLLLIVVILLQQGKGGDIANAFGGGGSQAAFGARAGATLLTKMTTILAGMFIVVALTLAAWGQRGPGTVVGGTEAPPPQPATPPSLPSNSSPK